jgi:hypothetical protein
LINTIELIVLMAARDQTVSRNQLITFTSVLDYAAVDSSNLTSQPHIFRNKERHNPGLGKDLVSRNSVAALIFSALIRSGQQLAFR